MQNPILIAGAGPTGLTAALELARQGVAVRIFDKLAAPQPTSRAIGVQARTLELLAARGLADELISLGNPAQAACINSGGARLFRIDFSRIASRYKYILMVSQADTERVLRTALERHGVTVQHGVELLAVAQDPQSPAPNPVGALLRHADGRLEHAQAPWLISAEGAHSLVRTTLDLQFEGRTRPEDYVLGDFQAAAELPPNEMNMFASEHGFVAMFPMGGSHFRMIANNPASPPAAGAGPPLDELQAIYNARCQIPARFSGLVWSSYFRINSRMVPRLKVGRLFLGGDSAHIHSPAGGQGMNTGIQDMINLAWKLAMVVQGRAPAALLDTYEQDRLGVIRAVLTGSEGLTDMIGLENPVLRGLFNHIAPWIGGAGLVQEAVTARISQVAIDYRHSPLSENHAHGGTLRAGDRVPDIAVRLRRGTAWQDATLAAALDPSRFVLLVVGPDEPVSPPHHALPEGCASVLIAPSACTGARAAFFANFGPAGGIFLVRPDYYVGFTAGLESGSELLAGYLGRWLGECKG